MLMLLTLVLLAFKPVQAATCVSQTEARELPVSGCNRAFSLHVLDMSLASHLDGEQAPAGRQWLIMSLRFDNWMPADLVFKLDYQEALLVGSLARQLYLLVDGQQVLRPRLPANAPSEDSFVLPALGEQQAVRVAFSIPEEPCKSLTLSYHHDQYADIVIPLQGELPDAQQQRQDALQQASNDVMSIGLHEYSFHDQWLGESAPTGMQWLVVDVRGQSEWHTDIDALALDANADVSEKAPLSRVMEYVGADQMLQAVVNGHYGYLREPGLSTMPATAAWLSYAWAGGQLVYAVPANAARVELVAYFGDFVAPGIASVYRAPLRFSVLDNAAAPDSNGASAAASIADSPTPVTVYQASPVSEYAGHQASADGTLLLLDVAMANTSEENGMMAVAERFRLQVEGQPAGQVIGAYLPGPHVLAEPFLLPAGEQRRLQLLYRLESVPETLELAYSGVSLNEVIDLPLTE